nr:MAG TPA: IrrE N-terminal-like domain [Caudoviricetes sp.]
MYDFSPYKAKPMSRKNIENIANDLRKLLELQDVLRVNVIYILEHVLSVLDKEFYLDIVPDNELDAHARAYPEDHTIRIRESIYERARRGEGRDRFTVMHEIFHFIWHDKNEISLARNPEKLKRYENPEWQADVFAASFLMPAHLIRGKSWTQVMHECGVSASAAKYQLKIANNKKDRV